MGRNISGPCPSAWVRNAPAMGRAGAARVASTPGELSDLAAPQ